MNWNYINWAEVKLIFHSDDHYNSILSPRHKVGQPVSKCYDPIGSNHTFTISAYPLSTKIQFSKTRKANGNERKDLNDHRRSRFIMHLRAILCLSFLHLAGILLFDTLLASVFFWPFLTYCIYQDSLL